MDVRPARAPLPALSCGGRYVSVLRLVRVGCGVTTIDDTGVIHLGPAERVTVTLLDDLIKLGGFRKLGVVPPLQPHADALTLAAELAHATTPPRLAMLLAQCLWECAGLTALVEALTPLCDRYDGGAKFRGRAYLHHTHEANYRRLSEALGIDLVAEPDRLLEPRVAARAAVVYWQDHKINQLVDAGDVRAVTHAINGMSTDEAPSWHLRRMRIHDRALVLLS